MGGGLFQLVGNNGKQDAYITGNPEITFFKSVYRKHTNFSMECIRQDISGQTLTSSDHIKELASVTISKGNGDLLNKVYVTTNQTSNGINGDEIIQEVELIIGGQRFDGYTKEWAQIWNELSIPESKTQGYKYMTGGYNNNLLTIDDTNQSIVIVPLLFWFCRYPGLSLPLVALQYHDITIKFLWGTNLDINKNKDTSTSSMMEVWADYIFLDADERKRFAFSDHEYLIEQIQIGDLSSGGNRVKYDLHFHHPVKEIIWTETPGSNEISNQKMNITINGDNRLALQNKEYYTLKQPFDHHTSIPGFNIKQFENPVMLSTPLMIVQKRLAQIHPTTPDATNMVSMISTNTDYTELKIYSNPGTDGVQELYSAGTNAAATTDSELKVKIGDIIQISLSDHDNTTATGTPRILTTCVSAILISNNIVKITTTHGDIESGVDNNYKSLNTDACSIAVIGRCQEPKSRCSTFKKNIYVYSFALNPEEHQPSGTLNFSRVDSAKLSIEESKQLDTVYAVNYNILRVSKGLGQIAFTN